MPGPLHPPGGAAAAGSPLRGSSSGPASPWPGAAVALGLLAGMALQLQQAEVAGARWHAAAALVLLAGLALWGAARRRGGVLRRLGLAALLAGAAAAGWVTTDLRAAARLAEGLAPALEGADLQVAGRVAGLPVRRPDGVRLLFMVDEARQDGRPVRVPSPLLLGWYGAQAAAAPVDALALAPGQSWALTVRLRRPHGTFNPGGFDRELWLFERGIGATGHVREGAGLAAPRRLAGDPGLDTAIDRARHAVREALRARLGDTPAAGLLAALSVGDQAAIARPDWDVFRATGVAHLVSISGLHVTMFAWLAALAVAWGWRRHPALPLWRPAPTAARWAGVLAAALYAAFAGWGVPAQRTLAMLALAHAGCGAGLRWPWPALVAVAAVAVCVLDPWALLQPGFWLSFVAVSVLMADARADERAAARTGWRGLAVPLAQAVRTQWRVGVVLAPLSLLLFQQASVVGLLANLAAIPVVTLVITPLALLGIAAPPLWSLGAWVAEAGIAALAVLAQWPLARWEAAAAPAWVVLPGLLAIGVMAAPLPWRLRALGAAMVVPLFTPPPSPPPVGQFELLAADVGQGTAVLVRTARHVLLYDAGPAYGPDSDAGALVLVPLLRTLGIPALDLLVLSHRDSDHVGGAAALLQAVPTVRVTSSLERGHALRRLAPHQPCAGGQAWQWDGVRFELLHPPQADDAGAAQPNARSCVLRVAAGARAALLPGDIERAQEAALVATAAPLAAHVLLVPHHGSRTSSSDAFLDAVRPRWAVVQAGYRNRYGHPAAAVLQRHAGRGIDVVRSDHCGAWRWRSSDAQASCERRLQRRYWHWRPAADAVAEPAALP